MGKTTNISWLNYYLPDGTYVPGKTFNPWIGCTKVSEGCKNCYAADDAKWSHCFGPDAERHITSDNYWKQPLKWNKEAEEKGIRYKVFCGSYCDVLENNPLVAKAQKRLASLVLSTPNIDWLFLTKRINNIAYIFKYMGFLDIIDNGYSYKIPDNVWIGTTVENQKQADIRIPELLKIPAKVRFISAEPLLGNININLNGIHWLIIGGESGSKRREMFLEDMIWLHSQGKMAGVPVFIKQGSAFIPGQQGEIPDWLWDIKQFPEVE